LDLERTQLRTLIDHLPHHIFIKDAQGRYVIDNAPHTRFIHCASPDEVVGKTSFDFFPREIAERYTADDQRVIQSGKALINREEPTGDGTGDIRWISTSKVPVLDPSGAVVAHEINNPLAFVTNNLAVLQRDTTALSGLIQQYQAIDRLTEAEADAGD